MKLDRKTPANCFEIKAPRWKQRVVGLADYKIGTHNEVEILAAAKDGKRYYPGKFYISGEVAKQQELQHLPQGISLRLVPIDLLEPLERV